jgi:2-hydroxy-3-oxopropionate reductase
MNVSTGFIGLGIMGRPMVGNLLKGGYLPWIFSRRRESLEPLIGTGVNPCNSPAEVAEKAEITFIMVSDTADVEKVISGPAGIIEGGRPGSVVVDMSTISPVATRRLAALLLEKGIEMLDAPVSGGEVGAINGTLSIMVGGKGEVLKRVKPLLECLGKNIVHIGTNGAGQVAKACNQILISMTAAALAEAFILARKQGVDFALVREALLGGYAQSKVLEGHGKRMLERDFQPGFKIRLLQKDLRIVTETAHQAGIAMPGAALVSQYLNALTGAGDGELDSAALLLAIERMNGRESNS